MIAVPAHRAGSEAYRSAEKQPRSPDASRDTRLVCLPCQPHPARPLRQRLLI